MINFIYLGVKLVKNVFEVVTLHGLLRVEELKELLHKLWGHKYLQLAHFDRLVDYQLQEELVDTLEMRPRRVHFFVLVDTCFRQSKIGLLNVGKWPENVLFDHGHDLLDVRDDELGDILLVREHLLELLDSVKALSLSKN